MLRARAVIGRFRPVTALVVVVVVLCAGCATTVIGLPTAAPAQVTLTGGPCRYTRDAAAARGKDVGLPTDPSPTPRTGTVAVTLRTTQGAIALTLNRAQAPCTVQSFVFLVQRTFYDDTPCHRLTANATPRVLLCGTDGPGYTIPDENPTGLTPAPGLPDGTVIYPAGTVAMANNDSQFFLVYGDSRLPPSYPVFGTVSAPELSTLDNVTITKAEVQP